MTLMKADMDVRAAAGAVTEAMEKDGKTAVNARGAAAGNRKKTFLSHSISSRRMTGKNL